MYEWLKENVAARLTGANLLYGFVIFVVTFAVTTAVVAFVVVKLPQDYFHPSNERLFWVDRHPALRWAGVIAKNIAGALLVVLGVLMSLPGIPGPGFVTILLGIMLLDFPGKRALELRLVRRPAVLGAINRTRRRFGRPALLLD
jgi:hypothetical protein